MKFQAKLISELNNRDDFRMITNRHIRVEVSLQDSSHDASPGHPCPCVTYPPEWGLDLVVHF